jgi:hypothetical protein
MRKATRAAEDAAAQLARAESLCLALDDVRLESERLYRKIVVEAQRINAAISTGEVARGLVTRTFDRGINRRQRPPRDRAD